MKNTQLRSLAIGFSVGLLCLLWVAVAPAQFVAFNGSAPGPATSPNTSTWNIFGEPPGTFGPLNDNVSGSVLPVTVTITTNGTVSPAPAGANPWPGTPLYSTFHGHVDFSGATGLDALAQISGAATVTYTFNGLNPKTVYGFKAGVVGGAPTGTDPQEWSLFQLNGARA